MSSINIKRKCPKGGNPGPCEDVPHVEATRKGLKGTDGKTNYEYCTHTGRRSIFLINLKYGGNRLKIEANDGQLNPFYQQHRVVGEVTTYYHNDYDKNPNFIKAPLVLKVEDAIHKGSYTWYENTGSGIKWKKIEHNGDFPTSDPGQGENDFTKRLDKLTCKLHRLHRVNIGNDNKERGDSYNCDLCKNASVTVKPGVPVNGIYSTFEHTPTEDGKYYLSYGSNLVKYKDSGGSNFIPLEVLSSYPSVTVYYWIGDGGRKNPLLIEVKLSTRESHWYENARYDDNKNDIWRKLGEQETKAFSTGNSDRLKEKLDSLNCIFNGALKIKLGLTSNCHNTRDGRHRDRLRTYIDGTFHRDLSLSIYVYTSREGSVSDLFNVAEIVLAEKKQKFLDGTSFFKDVIKVSSYESKCSPGTPFLLCIESNGNDYKWYWKTKPGNEWEVCPRLAKRPPGSVKDEIGTIFSDAMKSPLKITLCPPSKPPKKGIQIDISQQPKGDESFGMYEVQSSSGEIPIAIMKTVDSPVRGFFRVSHTANMATGSFTLSNNLKGGDGIRGVSNPIDSVSVYYWDGNPGKPILLEINDINGHSKYYSRAEDTNTKQGNWAKRDYESLKHTDLEEMLDDQNCHRNGTIPIDLKYPSDLKPFYKTIKEKITSTSPYLSKKSLFSSAFPLTLRSGSDDYEVEICKVENELSRVTYDGKETTGIEPPGGKVSKLRIYMWKHDPSPNKVPLLAEFLKTDGKHEWFENLGKESTNWATIGDYEANKFYQSGSQDLFTEELISKLDEVSCRIHHTVKIDMSRKNVIRSHCHSGCHPKRIKIKRDIGNLFPKYIGYEHTSATNDKTFTVTSIVYKNEEQRVERGNLNFPLREVSKVTVYFQNCEIGYPVAMQIEKEGEGNRWLKNEDRNGKWKEFSPQNIIETINRATSGLNLCPEFPKQLARTEQSDSENQDVGEYDEQDDESEGENSPPQVSTDHSDSISHQPQSGVDQSPAELSPQQHNADQPNQSNSAASSQDVNTLPQQDDYRASPNKDPNTDHTPYIIASSVLGASGSLTGFAYWIYKRFAGEPWVRQI
ncbi:hypothetical protein BEWA_026940 [Theileria equi strain WA]|uniref:Uncharacterized protein n=1 Tax=Theileria equi strain WA TaxID=1537102 RepID=L0AWC3_THEEQ|nr:hypothetical protein BEWA_026940 [Theileria equi strain WA]AFZ79845.1 hypothetical protein BEWA_026940 [Theileria equi strain WA]|eukprot:XP_004829511.1 hypothetical protein BEWA_026940 [Theileria equi strain WA]